MSLVSESRQAEPTSTQQRHACSLPVCEPNTPPGTTMSLQNEHQAAAPCDVNNSCSKIDSGKQLHPQYHNGSPDTIQSIRTGPRNLLITREQLNI